MIDSKYIQLKTAEGTNVTPVAASSYLTLAVPDKGPTFSDVRLHLQIRCSTAALTYDNASIAIDTATNATGVSIFDGIQWINVDTNGISSDYKNCKVLVNTLSINPDALIYYSWYYLTDNGITVHITPWESTRLTAMSGVPKHSELQHRDLSDQHPISAITGLEERLTRSYNEVSVMRDADLADVKPVSGKIITFIGYSTGDLDGEVVYRYKDSQGNFGNLGGSSANKGISAELVNGNLIITTDDVVALNYEDLTVIEDGDDYTLQSTASRVEDEMWILGEAI